MTVMPPNETPEASASAAQPDPGGRPALPEKSRDETDVGWGERPEPDDDERLNRDRPPHWDSA
jgi:hypothetical protein